MNDLKNNRRTPPKRAGRKRRGSKAIVFISLAVIFLALIGILSMTVFFKTESVTVEGRSVYSADRVISASGIVIGDNMFKSLINNAEGNIVKALPYIETAEIKRSLSGNVVITVTPAIAAYCFKTEEGFLLTSGSFKALEKTLNRAENLPLITGINLSRNEPGVKTAFADKDQGIILREILLCAKDNGIAFTSVDLGESSDSIKMTVENRIIVDLGAGSDIAYKMTHLRECLDQIGKEDSGTISFGMENEKRAYFRKNTPETEE